MENFTFVISLLIPVILISFIITFLILPKWIHRAKEERLVGKDVHKLKKIEIAEAGGVAVLIGFLIGAFLYIAVKTFVFHVQTNLIEILALISVLLFAGMVGAFDDLLGWKRGLNNKLRLALLVFASIPIMVLNLGDPVLLGINFGYFYPLFLVPLAIVGTTATFNFLAGYNGLEASQGMIILSALAIVTFSTGNPWLSVLLGCMVLSLAAFYLFNKYPAKVFPGDTLTYVVGAMIGTVAILGNIEKITLFFFIPYIIEVLLKLKGKLKIESFSSVQKDGSLKLKQKGIYGLEHLAILLLIKLKGKAYEWEVPILINSFQMIFIVLGFILFL